MPFPPLKTLFAAAMLFALAEVVTMSEASAEQNPAPEGLVVVASRHPFDETVKKLEASLIARTQTIFAKIDHRQNAVGVGLDLRPTTLIIFGNPKGGTPLMQASQSIGIELPMKFLVAQDASGAVSISYNDPQWLGRRHGLPDATAGALKAIAQFLADNAKAAAE